MNQVGWVIESIASFLECFYSCIICLHFFTESGREKMQVWLSALLSLGASGVTIILNQFHMYSIINTLLIFILICLMQVILLKKINLKIIACVFIYYIFIGIVDTVTIAVIAMLMNSNIYALMDEINYIRILCIIISKSILSLIVFLICWYRRKLNVANRYLVLLMCVLVAVTAILYESFGIFSDVQDERIIVLGLTIYCSMIIFVVFSVVSVYRMANAYEKKEELELANLKNQTLGEALEDAQHNFEQWKESVHNYKNNLIYFQYLLKNNEIEKLEDLFASETSKAGKLDLSIRSGNSTVNAILIAKKKKAEKNHIPVYVHAAIAEDVSVEQIHLCSVLGNLLDNAIEASLQEVEPYISVEIGESHGFIIIKVINKFSGVALPNMETRKTDKVFHGIGLKSVKRVAEMYNGELVAEKRGDIFFAQCSLEAK
jgi:signal transduction histidine kinase